jgi:hypothetical protein
MTTVPLSPEYQRFAASVAGVSPEWRESVDVATLLGLQKEERRAAIDLLIEHLDRDDERVPHALAAAEARGGVMPMQRRLPLANGRMKVAIALALASLEAIPRADEIVAGVLREGDPDSGLVALSAADEMRSVPIRDALAWSCLHHPAPEVRCNAGAILYYFAGLAEDPLAWSFRPVYLQLGEEDPRVREIAFEEICRDVGMPPELAG